MKVSTQMLERHRLALAVFVAYENDDPQTGALLAALEEKCDGNALLFAVTLLAIPHLLFDFHEVIPEAIETAQTLMARIALQETQKEQ